MNLFILDIQPAKAAEYNNDPHVRKIILESIEMMGCCYDKGEFKPWPWISKSKFMNHPMSKWVRSSKETFDWTLQHGYALCEEFEYRFGKQHKCKEYLDWISANLPLKNLSDTGWHDWPRCFGAYRESVGVSEDAVYDYRRYYMIAKRHLATWTKRTQPDWYR